MSLSILENLDDGKDVSGVSHEFFEDIDQFEDQDFDNYVIDVNVIYSVASGRDHVASIHNNKDYAEDVWRLVDEERLKKRTSGIRGQLDFTSTASGRVESLGELGEKAELYLPDITEDCVNASTYNMKNRERVLNAFSQVTTSLEVKEVMGIEEYSEEGLEDAGSLDEDQAILEAAQDLEGDTCILTYDSDFLSEEVPDDLYVTVPEIAYDTLDY